MTEENRIAKLLKSRLMIKPPINEDPRTLSPSLKNFIVIIVAMSAATPGFTSTIYFPGIPILTEDLHASSIATTLTATLFVLSMGITPVFWASLSDFYQIRRFWLILTLVIYVVSSISCAVINNIWGLVVLRCVQALGASAGQSIGGGVVADLYSVEQRGSAYSKFFLGVIVGPVIGPMIGGFMIMSDLTWRATFWFCAAFGSVGAIATFFFMPETFRDDKRWDIATLPTTAPSADESNSTNSETISVHGDSVGDEKQESALEPKKKKFNPFLPFYLLRYPHILLTSTVGGITLGSMFTISTVLPTLYKAAYGFNSWQIGLCFLGSGVGNVLATILNSKVSDRLLLRARVKRGGRHKVEDRLTVNLWSAIMIFLPFGLLLFGWSVEKNMTYWAGIVAFGILTFGMNQVITSTSAYLLDAVPGQGASATAAGNFLRMVINFALSLGSTPMMEKVAPGYLSLFLAALCLIASGLLFINKVYGHPIRCYFGVEQEAERKK